MVQQPATAAEAETYLEQISLENGQVVFGAPGTRGVAQRFPGHGLHLPGYHSRSAGVDRLKSEFVANVSHELRTPMTSIKGYVEIMLMGATGELTGQQRHFLDVVKTNTERPRW